MVALGADYDLAATPGLAEVGHEFYSVAGAEAVRDLLPTFRSGTAIVGVCGPLFKCPPAPSETALLLDELLRANGVRDDVRIQVVIPFGKPVPPSPATSEAILAQFAERGIEFVPDRRVAALDPATREAVLDDGTRLPFDLFLGIPVHRAPAVVVASGMTEGGWIPVDKHTLATRFPGVYAVGDVTSVGTPKAGVFAEGAARVVADQLIARIRGEARATRLRRHRRVLDGARRRAGRPHRRRLLLDPGPPDRDVHAAVRADGRREGRVRGQPPRPLVRSRSRLIRLTAAVVRIGG